MLPISGQQTSALYCPVEKVGSTFWRRFVYMLTKKGPYQHPLNVPIKLAIDKITKTPKNSTPHMYERDFKFMFVRDPYHRVLSAYIDKLYVPNPYFWDKYGKPAIKLLRSGHDMKRTGCYHDLSFEEFVRFVIWSERNRKELDAHFQVATEICAPCTMNFTFIGKMDNFKSDAMLVANHFQHQSTIKMLQENLETLAKHDAIKDSIDSPFSWKGRIKRCMNWPEATKRIWRKLQMRGLVDMDQQYPLEGKAIERTSSPLFVQKALDASKRSDPALLKLQKRLVFVEMYGSVDPKLLEDMRDVYEADFRLFDYNASPPELFINDSMRVVHDFIDFNKQDFGNFKTVEN